jgi:hypothetical protein
MYYETFRIKIHNFYYLLHIYFESISLYSFSFLKNHYISIKEFLFSLKKTFYKYYSRVILVYKALNISYQSF